ncbi:hypothetical protein CHS0354_017917 [Potamilus streckersoni]|uniref:Uncharacterized protein n=1 Tax=Potamilus streckersoni TaxID=2493646 RepID=A0AAE0RVW6_9BIVA|nr:hypothetical protein CHS0354_017917 [Potamilus streckersoni]
MGTYMQDYYEKPLLPDYSENTLACDKEITCATKEKTRYPQFLQHSTRLATFQFPIRFVTL